MTDLLYVLPDSATNKYTHLIPSLEKHLITTTDLLTLDSVEIARRAQLPLLDVRRLANHITAALQSQHGLKVADELKEFLQDGETSGSDNLQLTTSGTALPSRSKISTLDERLDESLGGGISTGYLTEIAGERYDFHSIFVFVFNSSNITNFHSSQRRW
jgi:DNA repair protein RAD57